MSRKLMIVSATGETAIKLTAATGTAAAPKSPHVVRAACRSAVFLTSSKAEAITLQLLAVFAILFGAFYTQVRFHIQCIRSVSGLNCNA